MAESLRLNPVLSQGLVWDEARSQPTEILYEFPEAEAAKPIRKRWFAAGWRGTRNRSRRPIEDQRPVFTAGGRTEVTNIPVTGEFPENPY